MQRPPLGRGAEQRLVQDLAAAPGAGGGVDGRGVEADDGQLATRYSVTTKEKAPIRLPSTNQVTLCAPGIVEVTLLT